MNILEYLPQTRCQLIGFILWLICHFVLDIYLGRTDKVKAASTFDLIFLILIASWTLMLKLFKGDKNE